MKRNLKLLAGLFALFVVTEAHAMRWYSPSTGRWFSRDPIEERGGKNLYGFVENDPVDHYDLLGLTIPGMCAEAYPSSCPCKCISVEVTFSGGGPGFKWGWHSNADGSWRFGGDINIVWKVKGPASRCQYYQRESSEFYFQNVGNLNAKTKFGNWKGGRVPDEYGDKACHWDRRQYTDNVGAGADFISPQDDGDWTTAIVTPPSITLECVSSDGTKVTKPLSIPPPPNPGKFPPD